MMVVMVLVVMVLVRGKTRLNGNASNWKDWTRKHKPMSASTFPKTEIRENEEVLFQPLL